MIPFICPTCGQFDLESPTCSSCANLTATVNHPADVHLFGDPALRLFGGTEQLPPVAVSASAPDDASAA
jgi:hypothetical protein